MPAKIKMIGRKFNRLTVIEDVGTDHRGEKLWKCRCECGKEIIALGWNIRKPGRGATKSCGCWNNDRIGALRRKHNMSKCRIFRIWVGIRKRCYNPKCKSYKVYGGAGIRVSEKWDEFENFYNDTKDTYADNLTFDRYPNKNGNYEPGNWRWANMKTQNNNRTNNRIISLDGVEKTLAEWSDVSGVGQSTIGWRLRSGWDVKKAIFTKPVV